MFLLKKKQQILIENSFKELYCTMMEDSMKSPVYIFLCCGGQHLCMAEGGYNHTQTNIHTLQHINSLKEPLNVSILCVGYVFVNLCVAAPSVFGAGYSSSPLRAVCTIQTL